MLRVDVDDKTVDPLYTDETSAFTSAQISPNDGRLYLTDYVTGGIVGITVDGTDARVHFTGPVDGTPMRADDLTFDEDGAMYVTDTTGNDRPGDDESGRIVRVERDGRSASVLADRLPAPNGISFDPDSTGLWVSEYAANRIDYLALDDEKANVAASHPAIHVSPGRAQIDSTAVDADGNIYQALHLQPRVLVFRPTGELAAIVEAPVADDGDYSATNLAIRPGTSTAYLTVSGPSGGFIYTFDALAAGTRQSNGG